MTAIAAFSGAEAALLFGSGYAANIGLLQAGVSPGDLIVSDERNHASLIDGIRLTKASTVVYPHHDLHALESALQKPRTGRAIVITESVFSMDGDLTPLPEVAEVAERLGAALIVEKHTPPGSTSARIGARPKSRTASGASRPIIGMKGAGSAARGWPFRARGASDVNRARRSSFDGPVPLLAARLAPPRMVERGRGPKQVHRNHFLGARSSSKTCMLGARSDRPASAGSNDTALARNRAEARLRLRAIRPQSRGTARCASRGFGGRQRSVAIASEAQGQGLGLDWGLFVPRLRDGTRTGVSPFTR